MNEQTECHKTQSMTVRAIKTSGHKTEQLKKTLQL